MARRRNNGLLVWLIMLPFLFAAGLVRLIFRLADVSKGQKKSRQRIARDAKVQGRLSRDSAKKSSSPKGSQPSALQVNWSRHYDPRDQYRIEYADRFGEFSERVIELACTGSCGGNEYAGIFEDGQFKTLRADRILKVEPLLISSPSGLTHPLHVLPTLKTALPVWPIEQAVFRVPQTSGKRHWTVNLNAYSCTCPESRLRSQYPPGSLGRVCSHMARAILDNLPTDANWDEDIRAWIGNPYKVGAANLL